MRKRWIVGLGGLVLTAVLVVIAASVAFMPGGSPDGEQGSDKAKKSPTVRVEAVRKAPIARTLELTGEVAAVNSVIVAATVEGPIRFCPWREGDRVQKGDKLIEIDRQTYRAEVQAAQASLAVAEAKLDDMKAGTRPEEIAQAQQEVHEWQEMLARAKTEFDRAKRLVEKGAVSQEDFERSQAEFKTAEAKLAAAQARFAMLKAGPTPTEIAVQEAAVNAAAAALELAKARLAECVITAPFDATVTAVHVRPGDVATAKAPLLEIVDLSTLVIRFAVPEAYASSIRPGMPLMVALDAYPGQSYRAIIERVYPTVDPRMRTRTVEAKMVDPPELVPGMFARLELELERVNDAIVVPEEAFLVTPKGEKYLFILHEGKALQRTVTTGIEQGRLVQVLQGVQPGEQVVVAGNEKLRDGMPVAVPKVASGKPGSGGKPSLPDKKPVGAGEAKP